MKKILYFVLAFFLMLGTFVKAEERYIVKFNDSLQTYSKASDNRSENRNYCTATYDEVQEYLEMGIVEYYEPDCEIRLFEDYPEVVNETLNWNLSMINIAKAWNLGCYGNEIRVAVIDSGVYEHPDLKGNILDGHNYTDNSDDTTDNIGHGTFVSGIIAAECNEAYMTGIAHQAKIVPLKCFDNGVKTTASMVADAIYDAVDVYGCDVINMSLGMVESLTNKTLELSVADAIKKGCIVVASVGNDNGKTEYYPAKYDGVIGVGSVTKTLDRSWFSQHNTTVDIMAPGSAIDSVSIESFKMNSGTSFSTPHVSAIAAIAKCIDPDISPSEFYDFAVNTATDLGEEGYDIYYGYGLINAEKIIDRVLEDKRVFLSHITDGNVKIYNNSDIPLKAVGIIAGYKNNSFFNAEMHDIEINPDEVESISFDEMGEKTKFMLWSSTGNLQPLHQVKIINR